jgi:DNA (cytosine-5)-methyltransferase 1
MNERHLWPVFYDLVRACRPGLILGEQVASAAVIGPASKAGKRREASDGWPWFSIVQSDLEDARYACGAVPFPAAGVGAPHNRMRLYWCARGLADSPSARFDGALGGAEREARNEARLRLSGAVGGFDRMADSQSERRLGWPDDGDGGRGQCASGPGSEIGGVGRSDEWIATEHVLLRQRSSDSTETSGACASLVLADDDDEGLERRRGMPERPAQFVAGARGVAGGVADTDGGNGGAEGLQRSGEQRFEPKDSFVGVMDDGRRSGPINGVWRDADWIFCTDGKWRPVEPGTQPLASGVPGRVGRLRAYGNAICVEQAKIFIESVFESLDSL